MSDPYKVLGVSPYATDDEISKAYKNLAKKYHPDNYTDNPLADLATEKMQEINQAYDEIKKHGVKAAAIIIIKPVIKAELIQATAEVIKTEITQATKAVTAAAHQRGTPNIKTCV